MSNMSNFPACRVESVVFSGVSISVVFRPVYSDLSDTPPVFLPDMGMSELYREKAELRGKQRPSMELLLCLACHQMRVRGYPVEARHLTLTEETYLEALASDSGDIRQWAILNPGVVQEDA